MAYHTMTLAPNCSMAATQRSNPCSAALFSFVTTFALLYMVNSLWSSSHSQMFATAAVHRMQPVAQPQGLSHMPLLVPGPDLYGNVARGHGPIHSSAAAQVVGYHSAQLSDETDHARWPAWGEGLCFHLRRGIDKACIQAQLHVDYGEVQDLPSCHLKLLGSSPKPTITRGGHAGVAQDAPVVRCSLSSRLVPL